MASNQPVSPSAGTPSDSSAGSGHPDSTGERTLDALELSDRAVARLGDALAALGITLPSLSIDLLSCSRPLGPRPLVELGRCNLETAAALTAALRRAAAQG
ncbi:hypothetical protein H181DRAFT_04135 [Streptomyces sp. WMMB 714]|uniref:hypothetical protein n=1 Tax=Streptomyces sp. WMMB 714 TaxID=1286822 RepID=UPI0008239B85|nr:hypothetical protein H181DRAFT_04135 [Streptomyces sp. WMMB 714]